MVSYPAFLLRREDYFASFTEEATFEEGSRDHLFPPGKE